jgi:hypothetical protein
MKRKIFNLADCSHSSSSGEAEIMAQFKEKTVKRFKF